MSTRWIQRCVVGCAMVLVWTPLAYFPLSLFPLSFVQVVVLQTIVAIMAIASVWAWYREPALRLRWTPLSIAVVVFLAVQWLCAVLGVDWWQSMWGDMARATGLWYQTHVVVALLIFASPLFTPAARMRVFVSSLFAASVVAVIAIVQCWAPAIVPNVSALRVGSTLGNPVLLASYLLLQLGIACVVGLMNRRAIRGIAGVYGVLALVALVFAQARGTYVGLMAGVLTMGAVSLVLRRRYVTKKTVLWGAGVLGSLAIVALLLWQSASVQRWTTGLLGTTTLTTRTINWGVAWKGFVDRPLVGWGPENYRRVSDAFYNPALSQISYVESFVDKPHNQFLELLATSGLVGVIAFLAVVILALRVVVLSYRRELWGARMVAAVVGVAVGHAVQLLFLFENPGTYLFVALALGWFVSYEQELMPATVRVAKRIPRLAVWGASAGIVVLTIWFSIVPLISSSLTNYAVQLSYTGAWNAAHEYAVRGYAWYTPYQLERWRWSAGMLSDLVHGFASDYQVASLTPEVRAWFDRDVRWIREKTDVLLAKQPRTYLLLTMVGKLEYQIGMYQQHAPDFERALRWFEEATLLSPTREEGYLLQVQALLALKRQDEAQAVVRQAMHNAGESALVAWYYGLPLLDDPSTIDEGLRYIQQAMDKHFVFETAAQVEAVTKALLEKKQYPQLVEIYERVVLQLPNDALWWSRLALAYRYVGRMDEARAAAMHAAELDASYREGAEQFLKEIDN